MNRNVFHRNVQISTDVIIRNGHSPYISTETGTWFEYNDTAGKYMNTGVKATIEELAALQTLVDENTTRIAALEKLVPTEPISDTDILKLF